MPDDKTRSYIDSAHVEFERLKQTNTASGTSQDRFNEAILETLHKMIHALDSIEKRIGAVREPIPSKIAAAAAPIVKREAKRVRAVVESARERALNFRQRLSDSMRKVRDADTSSAHQPKEIEKELAELRGDVRSVRDTIEALRKRLESVDVVRN